MSLLVKRRYSQLKKVSTSGSEPQWMTPLKNILDELESTRKIRELDRNFALFLARQHIHYGIENEAQVLTMCMLSALLSEQLGQQQVCLQLSSIPLVFSPEYRFANDSVLLDILASSPFVASNTEQESASNLFRLDHNRLYLSRYWHYEQSVARKWSQLFGKSFATESIASFLSQLYPVDGAPATEPDWQKVAIVLACLKPYCIIAGGPGTGKTTTVVRILWMLSKLYLSCEGKKPIIRMVAPTGKAAARLSESVSNALTNLPDREQAIPKACSTIHRLLGVIPGSNFFRHNAQRQLNLDVLVVDEASMIDLPLLAKMLEALPAHCRVIMLGDAHQLASVEVGSVFSDICSLKSIDNNFSAVTAGQLWDVLGVDGHETLHNNHCDIHAHSFRNHIVYLKKSYRFDSTKGIGQVANAINSGDIRGTLLALESASSNLCWLQNASINQLINMVLPHFRMLHQAVDNNQIEQAFNLLAQSQILAVQKSGKWGVENINYLLLNALVSEGIVERGTEFYPGRPVMVTRNDHQNKLFNGDIGIVFNDENDSNLMRVWFPDGKGTFRSFLPAQLPSHLSLYAMTTHKSQGSEFTKVILCMPEQGEGNTGLLNRELLYTAVTRSKEEFVLFAQRDSIQLSVSNRCHRSSGLADILE